MVNDSIYKGIQKVAQVNSGVGESCSVCSARLDATENFGQAVNHYLDHGYILLHVGQQTSRSDEGIWHETVAMLCRI